MKNSNTDPFLDELNRMHSEKLLPEKYYQIFLSFYKCYKESEKNNTEHVKIFQEFLPLVEKQLHAPFQFQNYHEKIRKPFDYYTFGLNFVHPLLDLEHSSVIGLENVDKMVKQIQNKENVVCFANHQTEVDPQIISLMLENTFPSFAEEMIFVAGDRVITDPLAIPFSMGRNLLCIFSKRYIDTPLELKEKKQMHNHKTMQKMAELLKSGGKAIYVAPSGGRDRKNEKDELDVAPFDPQSIEMFYLIAKKSKTPTHFYPLSLLTYEVLPPPKSIQIELGETRCAKNSPVHISFGKEIDMANIPLDKTADKKTQRKKRAEYIWNLVKKDYEILESLGG